MSEAVKVDVPGDDFSCKMWIDDPKSTLTVILSSTGHMMLSKVEGNCIWLVDSSYEYYVKSIDRILELIKPFAESARRVIFVGPSKGGFAAIVLGARLSLENSIKCPIKVVAFRAPNKKAFWLLKGYGTPPRPGSSLVDHRTVAATAQAGGQQRTSTCWPP